MKHKEYTIDDFVLDKDFRRWVIKPSKKDNLFWNSFLEKFPEQKEKMESAQNIVEILTFDEPAIDKNEYQNSINSLKKKIGRGKGKTIRLADLSKLWRVAAAVLIPFILVFASYLIIQKPDVESRYMTYNANAGQNLHVVLSDSTEVWLNAATELKVPYSFGKTNRDIILDGEAFFDVTHNKNLPFSVAAQNVKVEVLGTRFNVRAYKTDVDVSATLEKGSVQFKELNSDNEIILKPGEQVVFQKQNAKLTKEKVNLENFLGWKNGFLIFDKVKLSRVFDDVERKFNVQIEFNDEEFLSREITASFKNKENLEEVLAVLGIATPFAFEINEGQIKIEKIDRE